MNDKLLMKRCLELALLANGKVSPNPMVGCVIVNNGKIVGEGYHKYFGGKHAEVIALLDAKEKTKGATLYVNLEPCSHFGKTPPCTDAIIKSGIKKVVVATQDPNPLVKGNGIKKLKSAGIKVQVGVLKNEAEKFNEKFFKFMNNGIPYLAIKLAVTMDGRIADFKGRSKWITGQEGRKESHILRSQYDAIMVGANTVLQDNPELTVRLIKGRNPLRIIIDGKLSLPTNRKVFNTTSVPTWILTSKKAINKNNLKVKQLIAKGVRIIDLSNDYTLNHKRILQWLGKEGISSVLMEGGAGLIAPFISTKLVDKLYMCIAPKILGGGKDAIKFSSPLQINKNINLSINKIKYCGNDVYIEADFT